MKKINFIETREPKKQQQLSRWLTGYTILLALLVIGICTLQGKQLLQWNKRKNEYHRLKSTVADIEERLKQEQSLQHESRTLNKKLSHLSGMKKSAHHPYRYLDIITKIVSPENLKKITVDCTNFELSFIASDTERALVITEQLSKEPEFKNIHISSLQMQPDQTILVVIKNNQI
ncbi:hypothetical protein HRU45_04855 [Candidatus Dependentiae bacterium]|nr:hypothetical protein [Candidatus Dependentiae bacterium]